MKLFNIDDLHGPFAGGSVASASIIKNIQLEHQGQHFVLTTTVVAVGPWRPLERVSLLVNGHTLWTLRKPDPFSCEGWTATSELQQVGRNKNAETLLGPSCHVTRLLVDSYKQPISILLHGMTVLVHAAVTSVRPLYPLHLRFLLQQAG